MIAPLDSELNISMKTQFDQPGLAKGWADEQIARLRRNGVLESKIRVTCSEDIVTLWTKITVTVDPE